VGDIFCSNFVCVVTPRCWIMWKYWYLVISISILMGMTIFIYRNNLGLTNRGPLFSNELNRYIVLDFIPKYKSSDCAMRKV